MEMMPSAIQKENSSGYIYTESTGDFSLPDYLPEIRKLLKIETKIIPTGRYRSGGKVEFSGNVSHTVIYTGEDGELAATNLDSPYELSVPINFDGECELGAHFEVESVNCRLGGPRRITIRSKLRMCAHILSEEFLNTRISGDVTPMSIEKKYDTESVAKAHYATTADVLLCDYEKVECDSPENLKILYCAGEALVRESRRTENGVLCRGDVYLKCLCAEPGITPYSVSKKIPFESVCDIPVTEGEKLIAMGRCDGVEVTATATDGGCELEFNACVVIDCESHGKCDVSYISDIYCCEKEGRSETESVCVSSDTISSYGNFSISGSSPKSDETEVSRIIDSFGKISIESVEEKHGRASVSGNCQTCIIYCSTDEERDNFSAFEFSFPFRVEFDCDMQDGDFECECHGTLVTCRARTDATSFMFDGEVALALTMTKKSCFSPVSVADFSGEEITHDHRTVKIYYPTDNETLWDVAKRYRTSTKEISNINELSDVNISTPLKSIGKRHVII